MFETAIKQIEEKLYVKKELKLFHMKYIDEIVINGQLKHIHMMNVFLILNLTYIIVFDVHVAS